MDLHSRSNYLGVIDEDGSRAFKKNLGELEDVVAVDELAWYRRIRTLSWDLVPSNCPRRFFYV
jgi:hypothetical protein